MGYSENWQEIEKRSGRNAAVQLRAALRYEIRKRYRSQTGQMAKTNVLPRFRDGQLSHLSITSPNYTFVRHYGFTEPNESVRAYSRRATTVRDHFRSGGSVFGKTVSGYARKGGFVLSHKRSGSAEATGLIAEAIDGSGVIETLATDIAESRAIMVIDNKFRLDGK